MSAGRRRREAAMAGHRGDEVSARALIRDPDADVRATAVAALERCSALTDAELGTALTDHDPTVRRRAAALAVEHPGVSLSTAVADDDPLVVVAAAWTCAEQTAADDPTLTALADATGHHPDARCREAAVAALGSIGDPRSREAVVAATADRPAVRRRAVLALASFDGPTVGEALARARDDRDWQVRQAAEDLS